MEENLVSRVRNPNQPRAISQKGKKVNFDVEFGVCVLADSAMQNFADNYNCSVDDGEREETTRMAKDFLASLAVTYPNLAYKEHLNFYLRETRQPEQISSPPIEEDITRAFANYVNEPQQELVM